MCSSFLKGYIWDIIGCELWSELCKMSWIINEPEMKTWVHIGRITSEETLMWKYSSGYYFHRLEQSLWNSPDSLFQLPKFSKRLISIFFQFSIEIYEFFLDFQGVNVQSSFFLEISFSENNVFLKAVIFDHKLLHEHMISYICRSSLGFIMNSTF